MARKFVHIMFFTTFNFFYISNAEASCWLFCCDDREAVAHEKPSQYDQSTPSTKTIATVGGNSQAERPVIITLQTNDVSNQVLLKTDCLPPQGTSNQIIENIIPVENLKNNAQLGSETDHHSTLPPGINTPRIDANSYRHTLSRNNSFYPQPGRTSYLLVPQKNETTNNAINQVFQHPHSVKQTSSNNSDEDDDES